MTVAFRPPIARQTDAARCDIETESPPQHDARALIGRGQTAQITLDGMVYTLRITRAGKLILTK